MNNTKNHKGILAEICMKELNNESRETWTTEPASVAFDFFEHQKNVLLTQFNKIEIADDIHVFNRRLELM